MTNHEITLHHEIQVAHRLLNLGGKCQNIHGHSMHVTLTIQGPVSADGYMQDGERVLDFYSVKQIFRGFLDTVYDHKLLLNKDDPYTSQLQTVTRDESGQFTSEGEYLGTLPGLVPCVADPTTENLASWFYAALISLFKFEDCIVASVLVRETGTNGASCGA